MMKEWATVVSWENGMALLRCDPQAGCGSCNARTGCGTRTLNKLGPQPEHHLQVAIDQPLEPGQKVELGITEGSLLRSALLVYMTPLVGVLLGGGVMQMWLNSDLFALLGAVAGGMAGFLTARRLAKHSGEESQYQPVVLQIGLPPTAFRT
ncbi:SoxR-reducing system protein RseC [Nissabacter sp. SGAir0207]|uniref:SoxR-reducing system protein RseC n=1 Tax=Nissabacter sp. SGAir0207 TaxID=2126321 RepID=UPI0010CD0DCC|nr:SoxR-reducing system protein RseC [Nissabacter sp. SGAir0207]QCR35257.1 SoxR reducing system protein RseC [Nissabacter sp. SGAir0207]